MKKIILRLLAFGTLLILLGHSPAFSQGRKITPASKAGINTADIEANENNLEIHPQAQEHKKKKKIENEHIGKESHNLLVPANSKGRTFQVETPRLRVPAARPQRPAVPTANRTLSTEVIPAVIDNEVIVPPDCGGAVGPGYIMTVLNSQVLIQDKTKTVPPRLISLDDFFSPLTGVDSVFDPKIFYDPFGKRWFLAAMAHSNSPLSTLVIAVSSNADPYNSPWNGYSFTVDEGHQRWLDYPSIGFNKNWIVVTGNLFTIAPENAPSSNTGTQIYVFDKNGLYSGENTSPVLFERPDTEGYTICPAQTLDNSQETEYMVSTLNTNFQGKGYLEEYTITGTPASPNYAFTELTPNVNLPWAEMPDTKNNIIDPDFGPQKSVIELIQNNDSRMQSVVYRNGYLWCTHTAFLPTNNPTHACVQWWQIEPQTANTIHFGRIEDAAGENFYAFPSIAINGMSDMLIGYSSFSAKQFGSANYSFRFNTDPPNTMRAPVRFKAGISKYYKPGGDQNRWGDYSSTCVDPDDLTFWTLQEYAEVAANNIDRWGTTWVHISPSK